MFDTMKFAFKAAAGDRKGVTALEYGVIAAAIIALCIAVFNSIGGKILGKLNVIDGAL